MDLAKQSWDQVLLMDPNNTEALAGMARAAKSEGKISDANAYLAKLRAINPNDPNISRVESMGTAADNSVLLKQAAALSQQGQYARSMAILKQVYGNNPPPGDAAISYYQTEAATDDTRPAAIAGLRALADKYPSDPRYEIALGKILTYNPRTRAEGRKLLSKHPNDQDATEALRQSLVWDQQNPGTAGDIKAYLAKHPDAQLNQALSNDERLSASQREAARRSAPRPQTAEQKAAAEAKARQGRNVQEAYSALNAKRYSEAEQRFNAMLAVNPADPKALAGIGYIRMNQANFAGAISYLSQAQQNGAHDAGLEKALRDARFYYTMREATGALNEDDLGTAVQEFEQAVQMRPTDATALQGLGGTLLKAEQPEPAIGVYTTYVKLHGTDKQAWKGLFLSEASANRYDEALATDRRIPASIRASLERDPDYLRTLASVYSATNRDGDAQRVLRAALDLPFPADSRALRADTQMQYAGLLEAAGHHEQAAGLYRQVLAADSNNTNAWVGLVQTDHSLGNDLDAYQALQTMPPTNYQAAMQEPGFATTVASIYISQGHDDLAQSVLEEFLANQQANGQKQFVAAQVTLANLYLKHNNTEKAFPLFENILTNNPDRPDAWKGLLNSLHATGHDAEALAEIQQMPPDMRRQLEADPDYLQTVGSIYAALGHPADALRFLNRAKAHYMSQHAVPPGRAEVQTAWLLFNSGPSSDAALFKELMMLGGRTDLTDEERRTVQVIWTTWAVRRANQSLAAGNPKRAIAILNAAALAFPNNPGVLKALGSGYASVGLPKEAIQIFKAQDLSTGTVTDYRAAVGAALTVNDLKDAETWLRFGLVQYPRDSQLLSLAAKFEQARGNQGRAADYYRASLRAMPQPDPGEELAEEMAHPPQIPARLPSESRPQDLASLLAQPDGAARNGATYINGVPIDQTPYLPSYGSTGVQAPVIIPKPGTRIRPGYVGGTPDSYAAPTPANPSYGYTNPAIRPRGVNPGAVQENNYTSPDSQLSYPSYSDPTNPNNGYANPTGPGSTAPRTNTPTTLKDYVPQSSVGTTTLPGREEERATTATVLHLHPSAAMEAQYGPYRSFVPGETAEQGSADAAVQLASFTTAAPSQEARLSYLPTGRSAAMVTASFVQQLTTADGTPIVPYAPVARSKRKPTTQQGTKAAAKPYTQAGQGKPASSTTPVDDPFAGFAVEKTPQKTTANRPIHLHAVHKPVPADEAATAPKYIPPPVYIPPSTTTTTVQPYQHSQTAAQRAAAIRANQANAPLVLTGQSHPPTDNYDTDTNNDAAQMNNTQFSTQPYSPSAMQGGQVPQSQAPKVKGKNTTSDNTITFGQQTIDTTPTPGQQYPQPHTKSAPATSSTRVTRSARKTAPLPDPQPVTPGQPMTYPIYPQPLENEGTPQIPGTYPLGTPPSDYELQQLRVPPLRGYIDPRITMDPRVPLTERQQAQLDLVLIEGSFSNWVGGSVLGRYRSGTPGVDRLEALETPFEATFVLGNTARFSIVPKAVFLNSGQLVLNSSSTTTAAPILGTLYNNSTAAVVQQFSSGVGGEIQLSTQTIGLAIGYSPYGFLVSNLIGRARWRPGNGHFTLYGGRDSVKETQLSYAGLRDPGSSTNNGNIWGGVVESGGGIRFDAGDEHSGLYIQGEGADVTGYHVLENRKYDGTMGAYFRVATWPEYGSLNIGGTLYGSHYDYNERGETYGLGGYFSPNVYFLAAVPVTFNGHYNTALHYSINGSVGIQTFQEDSQVYFPLDPASQIGVPSCTANGQGCGLPVNSNTGLNYSIDAQLSYRVNDHWYIGALLSGNNTNNYNTISGGFFARYMFRPQVQTEAYPTGLFPVEGIRPIRVP